MRGSITIAVAPLRPQRGTVLRQHLLGCRLDLVVDRQDDVLARSLGRDVTTSIARPTDP